MPAGRASSQVEGAFARAFAGADAAFLDTARREGYTDGTTARITNWPEMTPAEQEKTRRVIVARNAKRLAKLEAAREL